MNGYTLKGSYFLGVFFFFGGGGGGEGLPPFSLGINLEARLCPELLPREQILSV